ncbi:MAG TPA: hypothetical protein VFW20_07035 [Candidatus Limnocylindrales bacterium]|nr:hypothetical protein [Candidatus Limnocylindrales bacterium]
MTEYRAAGGSSRRPRSSSRTAAMGSPGLPSTEAGGGADRIAELEARLERLEREPGAQMRERSRALMRRVMPAEANRHFRNAAREQLLGFRAIVDFWIARVDDADARAGTDDDDRMTIEVE